MSDQKEPTQEEIPVGRLTGKTTTNVVQIMFANPSVKRSNYLTIYGDQEPDGTKKYYLLNIVEIWNDNKGLNAKLQVLGERPPRPFDMGAEVYLANEKQISSILGIYNTPDESVSIGKLLGYPFDVNLLVKNFGRIFITGKSGSGKSYTMGVLCEEFLKKGIPVLVIDRHGEYASLKIAAEDSESKEEKGKEKTEELPAQTDFCPSCGYEIVIGSDVCDQCGSNLIRKEAAVTKSIPEGSGKAEDKTKKESKPSKSAKAPAGESPFINSIIEFADLNMNKGADIDIEYLFSLNASDLVAQNLCTIINLRGLDLDVQEVVANKILKKLYMASTSRQIPPFYLFLDEAHLFAGKKQTETCETVKLFSQEGRKFGANLVIGTQRPQLLDTTIRAQAGTWVIHQLSDVRDIGITISSAEDLSKENEGDISGLEKGQAIICGEAVKGIPLFIKVRNRKTKHGGTGFNPLDFLSKQTVEELQKRKERILGKKSAEELNIGKTEFQEIVGPKSASKSVEQIAAAKSKTNELEKENEKLSKAAKEWEQKYIALKQMQGKPQQTSDEAKKTIDQLNKKIKDLEIELTHWKAKANDAIKLADKLMQEVKKK